MLLSCSVYGLHPHDMQKSNAEFTISIRLTQALFNNSMHIILEIRVWFPEGSGHFLEFQPLGALPAASLYIKRRLCVARALIESIKCKITDCGLN